MRLIRAALLASLLPLAVRAADLAPLPRPAPAAPLPEVQAAAAPELRPAPVPGDDKAPVPNDPDPAAAADLFAMPRITDETRAAFDLIAAGDLDAAAAIFDELAMRYPDVGQIHASRAALRMLRGEPEAAMASLETAAAHGYVGLGALAADPLFANLAHDPRLRALIAAETAPAAQPSPPAAASEGQALVSGANTTWDPAAERLRPRFTFPSLTKAVIVPDRNTAATNILREHAKRGRAAGNLGDLYDNRDRGHSALDPDAHPQLTRVIYSEAAQAADVDYGLNDRLLFDHVTIGNSSTAITGGALWRSLPRSALTRDDGTGPMRLWQNASANQLYVYPSHRDYGPDSGDLFPANTPYLIVSHGSSGSDKPFLEAVAMILAAYRPDTKARLIEENLIVPMTQMVFRRSLRNVLSRADYFGPNANPAAFEAYDINLARMVSLAQSIKPGDIPPQVRIRVTSEETATEGVDFFGDGLSEQFFDTPAAIARIWRSKAFSRTLTLSADETKDPNGRPLSFQWRLLQGKGEHVRITPSKDGRTASISLDWQEPFAISKDNPVKSSRVDIGVYANNGVHDSAPAILSVWFPPDEARTYEPGPDGAMRIASIDYAGRPGVYADPMLIARADWRDSYHYDAAGRLTGWTRTRGGASEEYDAEGRRILAPADATGPARTEAVSYPLRRLPDGGLGLGLVTSTPP